ncbi:MAG: hypothetical protein H6Q86_5419 [candidate division NC10 bacterium]|nr:hypothetical protein [candidate division NC10 bacterium]
MKTKAVFVVLIGIGLCLTASVACADTIQYFIGVDDYGSLSINGTLLATFDSGGAGTTAPVAVTLPAGWYDITIDYKNRWGTDWLGLYWDPGPGVDVVPEAYLRSQNSTGQWVSGLKADYYWLNPDKSRGAPIQTIYGEGPLANGVNSYEGYHNGRSWPVVGYTGIFEEYLTGQIYVGTSPPPTAVPEPATLVVWASGLTMLGGRAWRRRRRG